MSYIFHAFSQEINHTEFSRTNTKLYNLPCSTLYLLNEIWKASSLVQCLTSERFMKRWINKINCDDKKWYETNEFLIIFFLFQKFFMYHDVYREFVMRSIHIRGFLLRELQAPHLPIQIAKLWFSFSLSLKSLFIRIVLGFSRKAKFCIFNSPVMKYSLLSTFEYVFVL